MNTEVKIVYQELLKNKYVRIAIGATLGIFVLILLFSPKSPSSSNTGGSTTSDIRTVSPSSFPTSPTSGSDYVSTISDKLPIHLGAYKRSANIEVDIDIFSTDTRGGSAVYFEIYGLSYANPDSSPFTNPNVSAFKDGYNEGLTLMKNAGIDPTKLTFIYSDIPYIQTTASVWVQKLGLHP